MSKLYIPGYDNEKHCASYQNIIQLNPTFYKNFTFICQGKE